MKINILGLFFIFIFTTTLFIFCKEKKINSTTVPIVLDHNRMLVDGEIQRKDGTWRKVRFWVDNGNPDLFISKELAQDLGIDHSVIIDKDSKSFEIQPPKGVQIGGMLVNFTG